MDTWYNKFPVCPLCGEYTTHTQSGGIRCTCGWGVDKDGDEDFDPDELEMYNEEDE